MVGACILLLQHGGFSFKRILGSYGSLLQRQIRRFCLPNRVKFEVAAIQDQCVAVQGAFVLCLDVVLGVEFV